MGVHRYEIFFFKFLHGIINGNTQEKNIHTQNHFNKWVVIELVFFYTLFIHMKKASYQHQAEGY